MDTARARQLSHGRFDLGQGAAKKFERRSFAVVNHDRTTVEAVAPCPATTAPSWTVIDPETTATPKFNPTGHARPLRRNKARHPPPAAVHRHTLRRTVGLDPDVE
jgi:hypothetical protein